MSERIAKGVAGQRVLVTIHRISFGGADRVAVLLCNAFVAAGVATRLAILRDGGEGETALLGLLDDRVEVSRAGAPMGSRHLELIRGRAFLRRETTAWAPDVVLASSSNMGLVTGLALRGLRRPRLVLKVTNPVIRPSDRAAPRRLYRRLLWRFVLGRFDRVLTLSEGERATLGRIYPDLAERVRTVANPYVTPVMLDAWLKEADPRPARILWAGRLMPQKRPDRMLKAFALTTAFADLVILGEGPLRPAVERAVAALPRPDRVRLAGFVDDVAPHLAEARVLALTSDYEGLPAVVLEALACGVPVVTTDCFDEARALLDGISGCAVVARDDVHGLAAGLDRALAWDGDRDALRQRAMPWALDAAFRAHIEAIFGAWDPSERPVGRRLGRMAER